MQLSEDGFKSITLKEVISWRLLNNGTVEAMLIDENKMISTPVYREMIVYMWRIKIKTFVTSFSTILLTNLNPKDPEAMAAITLLKDG